MLRPDKAADFRTSLKPTANPTHYCCKTLCPPLPYGSEARYCS